MLLLMITLPIIPYCTVLSLGKVPFQLGTVPIDWEALTAPVVMFILILPCGVRHVNTEGTLSTWTYLACETSVRNCKKPTFETELRALLKGQRLRQTKHRPYWGSVGQLPQRKQKVLPEKNPAPSETTRTRRAGHSVGSARARRRTGASE
jgi:hypothetical protein